KYTKGILTTPSIPGVAGNIDGPTLNTSDVLNRGIEVTVGWRDRIGKVNYNVRGNFSYNFDQVKNYLGKYIVENDGTNNIGLVGSADSNDSNRYIVEGYRIGEYYLRETYSGTGTYFHSDGTVNIHGGPRDGMIRTENDMNWVLAMQAAGYTFSPQNSIGPSQLYYGDLLYADLNNDGIYGDSNDRTFTGKSPLPKYNYGFNIDVEWNNFDLSMIWAGSAGMHYHFLATGYNSPQISSNSLIPTAVANDHYYYNVGNPTDPTNNLNGFYPRLSTSTTINGVASNRWLYNASYLKLKNLQIGYTVPATITERYNIANLRIFATGENLLMFTKYPFMDPERGSGIGYLPMRQFAFGLNVSF
ncbi:MAG: SusC/RagA family protein, partial [Tannerellaceae bacterium]|nr:SusC/RagA family protein [Tannerellaceae bacterium]